jgi:hypothetical protein
MKKEKAGNCVELETKPDFDECYRRIDAWFHQRVCVKLSVGTKKGAYTSSSPTIFK